MTPDTIAEYAHNTQGIVEYGRDGYVTCEKSRWEFVEENS
jgi:hypothetical protein